MRVAFGDRERSGRAVDLAAAVDPARVVAAVRTGDGAVECPEPGPAHDHVGLVEPGMTLRRRAALAAAARSRGLEAPQRDELARVREELATLDPPDVALAAARERAAEAGDERARLRERVAALRGRVQALRDAGAETATAEAEAELAETAAALAEVETERAAAEQALERARDRARDARDARERRLRLEDREANLERAARAWLADEVRPAVDAVVPDTPGASAEAFADARPVTATLAVARVADLAAPVVLACHRFASASGAADWLDAPVIRV